MESASPKAQSPPPGNRGIDVLHAANINRCLPQAPGETIISRANVDWARQAITDVPCVRSSRWLNVCFGSEADIVYRTGKPP